MRFTKIYWTLLTYFQINYWRSSSSIIAIARAESSVGTFQRILKMKLAWFYLFLNHELLAEYITRLVSDIWSHCTTEANPVSKRNNWSLIYTRYCLEFSHEEYKTTTFRTCFFKLAQSNIPVKLRCIGFVLPVEVLMRDKRRIVCYQLKEASVKDANATPPTIGTSEETTQIFGLCVHSMVKKLKVKSLYHQ